MMKDKDILAVSSKLSKLAVDSLIEEAKLTPKPGLVDSDNSGAHTDLNLRLMIKSAKALEETFRKIAYVSYLQEPNQLLREQVAEIGRMGEQEMFQATDGVNTHKGAIWALGLLISGAAMSKEETDTEEIVLLASKLACFPDSKYEPVPTNGSRVSKKYGVQGARGEAQQGFPHIIDKALPTLRESRQRGVLEQLARVNALLSIMTNLDDTCILHRGGTEALAITKKQAANILDKGGVSSNEGWALLQELDKKLVSLNASPGGSADLLAATLFLDRLLHQEGEATVNVNTIYVNGVS